MFDLDNFREIWGTIKKNKLRTFLTGFSVSWGIFMLIVLLGAGNGLRNGVLHNFRNMSKNMLLVWPRYTTKPWKGMQPDRRISFKEEDLIAAKKNFKEISLFSASIGRGDTITYDTEYFTGRTEGVLPDHSTINNIVVNAPNGRFINEQDIRERRKVIVLTDRMREVLFRDTDPIGKYVRCGNLMFQVIGVYTNDQMNNNSPAFLPLSVSRQLYNKGYGFDSMFFMLEGIDSEEESEEFESRFRTWMAHLHQFDPTDNNAIGMWNSTNEFLMMNKIMNGITLFIWIIGIATLMAGIVGVSNIMLITVRERTREIGIRKALGAKPQSILGLIITESIIVTAIFGYIGMMLGIGLTEFINHAMQMAQPAAQATGGLEGKPSIFLNPTVDLSIAISAMVLIVVAGVFAGYFPARKAVKIPAIEAMRAE